MPMLDLDQHTRNLLERLVIAIEDQNELQKETNEKLGKIMHIIKR